MAVLADFVMQMRAGGFSGRAYLRDFFTAFYFESGGDKEPRAMRKQSAHPVAVIEHDHFAVSVFEPRKDHRAIRRGAHRGAGFGRDICSGMQSVPASQGMPTIT